MWHYRSKEKGDDMTLVKCTECGSDVSTAAAACPKCGHPVVAPAPVLTRTDTVKMWLMFLALAAGGVWFIHHKMSDFNDTSSSAPDPELSRQMDAAFAFGACEKAIKSAAKNPSSAVIPSRPNLADSGGFMFAWKKGDGLLLQNAYGAKLDTTATCIVNDDKQTVMALVIDGKKLIYKKKARN